MRFALALVLVLTPFMSVHAEEAEFRTDNSICYQHLLKKTQRICSQAVEVGATALEIENCGFCCNPITIRGCLRQLIISYGHTPRE